MTKMTEEQIKAARERCEAATDFSEIDVSEWVYAEDGEFALHARTDLLAALNALEEKDEEVARLKVANTVLDHRVDEAANVVGRLETEVERMGEFIAQVPRHAVAHKYWAALAKTETEGS